MEVILLFVFIVGAPIVIVGGAQILIWKLVGTNALRVTSAILVLICGYYLLAEAFAPPVLGNKSGLAGIGVLAIIILMVENLLILCVPILRRYMAWEKCVETRWATDE